jgi:outer membrane protein assembly factor BamB
VIDGKVYIGDEDGDITVLEASPRMNVIAENTVLNSSYTTPVAANGVLYVANRSDLYALAPTGDDAQESE